MDCFCQIHPPLLISDWCARLYGAEGWCCGWEKEINETNQLDLTGYLDNSLSSWRVYPGCTLTLFNEHNNVGFLASSTEDVRGIGLSGYNDQVSSLSCTCQGMITTPTHLEPYLIVLLIYICC